MQIDGKDYLILKAGKNKNHLAKVIDLDPLKAILCDEWQKDRDKATYVDFEMSDVIANLGKKPQYGDAYRVPVEYIRQTFDIEPWGSVNFYKEVGEEQHKRVMKSIKKVTSNLQEFRIFPLEKSIHLSIKELKGTEGGHYKRFHNPKKDDAIVVRAMEFNEIDYVLYHELAHGVWFMLCDDDIKSRWIKVFYNNIDLIKDTEKKMFKMRKEMIDAGSIKNYKRELDDEDTKKLFGGVIKFLHDKYCISVDEINCLISQGEDLTDIWPKEVIPLPKQGILVTEYANKNVKELFAECFAFYFDERKTLPKSMEKLMEKTIAAVRYGRNSSGKVEELDDEND